MCDSDSDTAGTESAERERRDSAPTPAGYELRETTPSIAAFRRIRREAGMTDRSREAVERGLPNTTYGVHIVETETGTPVGMARIIGDDGTVFHVTDMAVVEAHQGRSVGTAMMDALVEWLRENAPEGATVDLLADVDGFYERWGFKLSAPASKGMWIWTDDL